MRVPVEPRGVLCRGGDSVSSVGSRDSLLLLGRKAVAAVRIRDSESSLAGRGRGWWEKPLFYRVALGWISLQITHALCEVVSVLQRKTLVQRLLPYLLPSLLGQVSETLGEELASSIGDLGSADMPGR